jgi:hypothetical protein
MALGGVEKVPAVPAIGSLNSDDKHREYPENGDGQKSDACEHQNGR